MNKDLQPDGLLAAWLSWLVHRQLAYAVQGDGPPDSLNQTPTPPFFDKPNPI